MNPSFEQGRVYQKAETYAQIQQLLGIADDQQLRELLTTWSNELLLELPKIIILEEQLLKLV